MSKIEQAAPPRPLGCICPLGYLDVECTAHGVTAHFAAAPAAIEQARPQAPTRFKKMPLMPERCLPDCGISYSFYHAQGCPESAAAEPAPERTTPQDQVETGWKPSEYQRGLDEASKIIYQAAKREGFVLNPQGSDMGLSQEVNALIRCAKESARAVAVPEPAARWEKLAKDLNWPADPEFFRTNIEAYRDQIGQAMDAEKQTAEPTAQQESDVIADVLLRERRLHDKDCGCVNDSEYECDWDSVLTRLESEIGQLRARQAEPAPTPSRQLNLMEMPSGLTISQQFTSVEFMFTSEDDAEKFFICVSESFRRGTPFTIKPVAAPKRGDSK